MFELGPIENEKMPGCSRDNEAKGGNRGDKRGWHAKLLRRDGCRWGVGLRRLRLGRDANSQRIDPDPLGDVFELRGTKVGDSEIEPPPDLPIGVLRETDRARLANAFQSRGDIDVVAHESGVALLNDVAQVNADTKFDAALGRYARIALDHAVLNLERAAHCVDHAAELDEAAIASSVDDTPAVHGDRGIDQIAAQPPQPRQRTILVHAGEPAVAHHVRDKDRSDFSGLAHRPRLPDLQIEQTRLLCHAREWITFAGSSPRPWVAATRVGPRNLVWENGRSNQSPQLGH